jgi:2-polyprenyl-3-methyl-5-hydroxy-6-metoxy-1,4-benzoquinol methylase
LSTNLYDRYTSTHMLADENPAALLAWSRRYFQSVILPHVPSDLKANILECGCGYGRNIQALRAAGYSRVTGIDISEEQVRYAREQLGLNDIHKGDASAFLRESDATYDVVLLLDVLEHLDVDTTVEWLELIRSRLSRSGKIIIQVPNALCPMNLYRDLDVTHYRSYTDRSMAQTLRLAGFSQTSFYGIPPLPIGLGGSLRHVLWRVFLNPLIRAFMWACHGSIAGSIFTGNLLAVVSAD